MKTFLISLCLVSTLSLNAKVMTIACGDRALESLEKKDIYKAEVYVSLELNELDKFVAVKTLMLNGQELVSDIEEASYKDSSKVTLNLTGYDSFYFSHIKNCTDLNKSSADLLFLEHIGGFIGVNPRPYKCHCLVD